MKNSNGEIPIRRHPNCPHGICGVCLDDHEALDSYLMTKLGFTVDWLREYRLWLDRNQIPAEVHGWASMEAFDPQNINRFVAENTEKTV